MTSSPHDTATLAAIAPLRAAGFALHWLHPREKRPIGGEWQKAPVASLDTLISTHIAGANLGARLGEPSALACGGYLHVLDLDIRVPDLADEAWEAFENLFPGVDRGSLPSVVSGSGGESRHLYLVTEKQFSSKRLAVSEGKHRREKVDQKTGEIRQVWSYDWEIELFGTNKQVAMPPSIHPDTGKPYVWERTFDFDLLDLGIGPFVPAAAIEAIGAAETETFAYEAREPLTFEPGQLERDLSALPLDRINDRNDWVLLGQALHHQFGGSDAGFELWMEASAKSDKFLVGSSRPKELRRYRGFGKNRRQPVTMGTIRQWAQDARADALRDAFDDLPEDGDDEDDDDAFGDLFGESEGPTAEENDPLVTGGKPDPEDEAVSWVSLLDLNEEGAIKPTLHNVELILANDPRLKGLPQLNEFTQETVQRTPPGLKPQRRKKATKQVRQLTGRVWDVRDTLNGELWSDDRDFAIRSVMEAPKTQGGYGIKISDRDLKAAIVLAANATPFHPVREYLTGLQWDGTPRVELLFTDYVGAPDNIYTRSVARLMMLGAVTRIFEPGHKFDFAVILEGFQGKRKSTFIQTLGRRWFAELDGDFHDPKLMVELMQGAWIMEIPELSGFQRSDVRAIKAFISRQRDRARLAYARRAGEFPRQCIFIGSTNDREYLKDDTGGRRFWPIECTAAEIDISGLETNVDQLWAEAVALYHGMRRSQPGGTLPLYLADAEAREHAVRLQESRRVETADDALAGRIEAWLARPVSSGRYDDDGAKPEPRVQTCLAEVWTEVLGGDPRSYGQVQAQSIGRAMKLLPSWVTEGRIISFPAPYGRQRAYFRAG